jgi:hypothetical protein
MARGYLDALCEVDGLSWPSALRHEVAAIETHPVHVLGAPQDRPHLIHRTRERGHHGLGVPDYHLHDNKRQTDRRESQPERSLDFIRTAGAIPG